MFPDGAEPPLLALPRLCKPRSLSVTSETTHTPRTHTHMYICIYICIYTYLLIHRYINDTSEAPQNICMDSAQTHHLKPAPHKSYQNARVANPHPWNFDATPLSCPKPWTSQAERSVKKEPKLWLEPWARRLQLAREVKRMRRKILHTPGRFHAPTDGNHTLGDTSSIRIAERRLRGLAPLPLRSALRAVRPDALPGARAEGPLEGAGQSFPTPSSGL